MFPVGLKSREPRRILVIALRFLGDVLLTTPLLHSLKAAYPHADVDVLVFPNTAAMLEGNPDIGRILTIPNRPALKDQLDLLRKIFRHYDLSVAVQTGDRPFLYCVLSARCRVAAVPMKGSTGWWKRFFLNGYVEYDNENTHTLLQHLKLLDPLGIPASYSLVPPRPALQIQISDYLPWLRQGVEYVLMHPCPQWVYKQWPLENWILLGNFIHQAGLKLVLSGGPDSLETEFLARLCSALPEDTINLAGRVSLAQLAQIIAGARCFIGPDTGITHLAAAMCVPVVVLFGPTNPVKWAPWPCGYASSANPYRKVGDQTLNNVYLLQGREDCVPCDQEGCERYRQSRSRCLDFLPLHKVESVVRNILNIGD